MYISLYFTDKTSKHLRSAVVRILAVIGDEHLETFPSLQPRGIDRGALHEGGTKPSVHGKGNDYRNNQCLENQLSE